MLRKDMPNFKGWKERCVVLYSIVFLEKVACSVGFLSWELSIWSPCIHNSLELWRQNTHIRCSSILVHSDLAISHSTSFISVQCTFWLLPVHSSLCYLSSSSQRLYCKLTLAFPLKSQLASSLLSFGKHPCRFSHLISHLWFLFSLLFPLASTLTIHTTHMLLPQALSAFSPALCFPNLTFSCSWVPFSQWLACLGAFALSGSSHTLFLWPTVSLQVSAEISLISILP